MKLIVGLGNPGSKYSQTRHNIGRLAVETLAQKRGVGFQKNKSLKASLSSLEWNLVPVTLAYPETFMNVSGEVLAALVRHFNLDFRQDLLVVVDDSALEFGRLRLRGKGSEGGHNGLKSIHQALATPDYPRLRIGIGPPVGEALENFVLDRFRREEIKDLPAILEKAHEACGLWIEQPIERAMNAVNSSSDST